MSSIFLCTTLEPSENRPLFISATQRIFDTVHFWIFEQESQIFDRKIPGDEVCSYLTPIIGEKSIVIILHQDPKQILDVRLRFLCKKSEAFILISYIFYIKRISTNK